MSRITLLTRARAPYLRALHECFATALAEDGSSFTIVWPADFDDGFPQSETIPSAPNLAIVHADAAKLDGPVSLLTQRWKNERIPSRLPSRAVWQSLSQSRPNLIWIHEFSPFTLTGLLLAKQRGIPVVVSTEVGRRNAMMFTASVRVWHRLWGHLVDGVIACCPAAREPMCGEALPVVDAFHAVDSRQFTPRDPSAQNAITTFVYVGQMVPRKGLDLLMQAAGRLLREGFDRFKIRLVGRDSDQLASALADRHGLRSKVELTGFLSGGALQDAVRSADVFVLPTRQDTYAAVVQEAACLGMPLLVSQHAGACASVVRDGINGFVIDPEDAAVTAQRMRQLCEPSLRRSMSSAARARGEELSAHRRGPAIRQWMRSTFAV